VPCVLLCAHARRRRRRERDTEDESSSERPPAHEASVPQPRAPPLESRALSVYRPMTPARIAAMHFRFEHDFEIDAKDYWDLFFSDDYNKELYEKLKMRNRQVLDLKDDGKTLRRQTRLTPEIDIPKAFRAVISDMTYVEHNTFHRERSAMDVLIEPALLKNKFDFRGVYAVAPLGPGRSRRTFEGDVKISVMIIGGQIEKYMVEQLRSSYEIATDVTRRFIAKRKAEKQA
jgi:hypothetical protein